MALLYLYECSVCGGPVKVTPQGLGVEPLIERGCGHDGTTVYANRKVTMYGRGTLEESSILNRVVVQVTLSMRQFLSHLSGRSI